MAKRSAGLLLALAMILLAAPLTSAEAAQRAKVLPGLNGTVVAMAGPDANGVTYLGGTFSSFNPIDTGRGSLARASNGAVDTSFPKVAGGTNGIRAVAADGSGGFYIGGDFTTVDGVTRNRAAHINSDGSLDANWNPNLGGQVNAIAVSGSSVYLGGDFTSVGGTTRNRAAKVDATTGALDSSWNPNVSSTVNTIAVSGSSVYLGGKFALTNSINGNTTRNRAAKVDSTNGTV
ncbi:MAG: delta-60 repeat domain-containing protein, partial [Ilumatobacteraceae bacterium]